MILWLHVQPAWFVSDLVGRFSDDYFSFILLNIIPGASSGIGEGTAVHLAKLGSRLSLAGRSVDNLKRVAGLCQEQGVSEQNVSGFHNGLRDRQSHKRNMSLTATDIACVHGSTNSTNGIPISFKVLRMVPLIIPLVPMVPLVKTDGSQYYRQSTV